MFPEKKLLRTNTNIKQSGGAFHLRTYGIATLLDRQRKRHIKKIIEVFSVSHGTFSRNCDTEYEKRTTEEKVVLEELQ